MAHSAHQILRGASEPLRVGDHEREMIIDVRSVYERSTGLRTFDWSTSVRLDYERWISLQMFDWFMNVRPDPESLTELRTFDRIVIDRLD